MHALMPPCFTTHALMHQMAILSNALDAGMGTVLEQYSEGEWHLLCFSSQSLFASKHQYSVFNQGVLAAYSAVRHSNIKGYWCSLFTDHWPLAQTVQHISDPWSPPQQRHLSMLAEFLADIFYLLGKQNVIADTLFRSPVSCFSVSRL